MLTEFYPDQFVHQIIKPGRLEYFEDESSNALRVKGYSAQGQPCFYFHTYSMSEPRIDCDDEAFELIVYYERVLAWRLNDGHWIQKKIQARHPVASVANQQCSDYEVVDVCEWFS